nr:GTPase ObgE [Calditrichia bacterium]
MFIDFAKIHLIAGSGGNGCMSFRREKYVPKGGPNGGDGGHGGSIVLEVNPQLRTLVDFTYQRRYQAPRGQHGMGSNKHGRKGEDIVLQVPAGTVVKNGETDALLADLTEPGEQFVVAKGGRGGRGNARFVTSTHRAPREYEEGEPGEELDIVLELKLIADVGLVGKPNAGKSTLLANISAARPKIAGYPFTTLEPNLGIVRVGDFHSFVMADIPGLIEGAHEGKGLGLQFLRHIERNRLLVYLIDPEDPEVEDPRETFTVLQNEVRRYSLELAERAAAIVLTKRDTWQETDWLSELGGSFDYPVLAISAVAHEGLQELRQFIWEALREMDKSD